MLKIKELLVSFFVLTLIGSVVESRAQQCTGAFGDPVAGTDFGRGSGQYGPPLNVANTPGYRYLQDQPGDGAYTLTKSTSGMPHVMGGRWHNFTNHTPGDPDGYMMVVNADYTPRVFYQTTVDELCPSTTYEFAAYIMNILQIPGIDPKLTFIIENAETGAILQTMETPEIERTPTPIWIKQNLIFTTPTGVSKITLRIINNAPGGNGNDLALDDITFRACGPEITPTIGASSSNVLDLCEGASGSFTLNAAISSGYTNPIFQWQRLEAGQWVDIAGETTQQTTVTLTNAVAGSYQYRLAAAEKENFASPKCRVASRVLTINVLEFPKFNTKAEHLVCLGQSITLDPNNTNALSTSTYRWTGPNGFTSNLKNPILNNVTATMAGTYHIEVANGRGCSQLTQTELKVLPVLKTSITADLTICKGISTLLSAAGGTSYKWLPSAGLSADDIAEPEARPGKTTTYTVTISNGGCHETRSVTITVLENPLANAGEDKRILQGQSIVLDGKAAGDNITFEWSPPDYLDNPKSLTPTATPAEDITYTLMVYSAQGCITSTDEVSIRVFAKLLIPTAFSPNGDNVNDVWNITPINTYPKATVKIMNRNGETVFSSKGYATPWNGKYNGQDVPSGAYYYIINPDPGVKKESGWVMVIR